MELVIFNTILTCSVHHHHQYPHYHHLRKSPPPPHCQTRNSIGKLRLPGLRPFQGQCSVCFWIRNFFIIIIIIIICSVATPKRKNFRKSSKQTLTPPRFGKSCNFFIISCSKTLLKGSGLKMTPRPPSLWNISENLSVMLPWPVPEWVAPSGPKVFPFPIWLPTSCA